MKTLLSAAGIALMCTIGLSAHAAPPPATGDSAAPANETSEQRRIRLQHEADQQRYEQGVRDADAARQRYEAAQAQYQRDLAAHQREVERADQARANYDRQIEQRQARETGRHGNSGAATSSTIGAARDSSTATASTTTTTTTAANSGDCLAQQQRNRRRGRVIGGVLGGVAGVAGSQIRGVGALAVLAVPVGALIGDQIASHLNCREQHQAALATEEATRGGVGTTSTWTSDTRPGVTGSSTVTAADAGGGGGGGGGDQCVTVTDVIIVDGQETRAPKHMCRRPPSNRYVRV